MTTVGPSSSRLVDGAAAGAATAAVRGRGGDFNMTKSSRSETTTNPSESDPLSEDDARCATFSIAALSVEQVLSMEKQPGFSQNCFFSALTACAASVVAGVFQCLEEGAGALRNLQ